MRTIDGMTSAGYLREMATQKNVSAAQSLSLRGIADEMEFMDADNAALNAEVEKLSKHTYCTWCGHAIEIEGSTLDDVKAHVESCPKHPLAAARAEIAALKAEVAADQARYYQLLFAVEKRYPNESRHETALRYIREAEMATSDSTNTATSGGEGG